MITILDLLATLAYTAQYAVGHLCHTTTTVYQVSLRLFLQSHFLAHQLVAGLMASQVLGYALAFGELHRAPICPGISQALQLLRTDLIHAK